MESYWDFINFTLDFILIGAGLWLTFSLLETGGEGGSLMVWGAVVLGLAHILETVTFQILKWPTAVVEFSHRLIVLSGFILLVIGYKKLIKSIGQSKINSN